MQNQNTYSEILEKVKTTQEAFDLIEEIDEMASSRFKFGAKKDMKIKTYSLLKKFQTENEAENKLFLEGLRQSLKNAPVVKMEIAFEPRISTVEMISAWLKANVGNDVLVEINIKPHLLLGARVSFNGRYGDYSLRKKYEKF